MKKTGIYKIANPDGNIYIGQARNIIKRWWTHKKRITTNLLSQSFLKHGSENHTFEIIHELPTDVDQEVLWEYEKLYIQLYKDCGCDMLNMHDGGGNGFKASEETKIKQSAKKKGIPLEQRIGHEAAQLQKERMSLLFGGKKHSAERIESRVSKIRGRKLTPDQKKNLGKHRIGVEPWNKGLKGIKFKKDINAK